MDSFDFNIKNYSMREMEDLLGLATNKNYNAIDVVNNKQRLVVKLASSGKQEQKMMNFLDAVSKCLVTKLNGHGHGYGHGNADDNNNHNNDSGDGEDVKKKIAQEYYSPIHNFDKNTIIPGTNANDHFVIPQPYRMYDPGKYYNVGLTVGQSGAPPGTINPVKYSTIVSTVNIDSRFRSNYFTTKSSDLNVTLPEKISNVINYRIGSLEIPFYAIYSITELRGNNAIQILWDTNTNPNSYANQFTIVIPDGNYYSTNDTLNLSGTVSIETTINTIINSNTVPSGLSGLLTYYIDQTNGKSVFAQPSTALHPIHFKIITNVRSNGELNYDAPLMSFLGWTLGFRNAEYISKDNGTGNYGAVVSEALVAIKAAQYIFIAIDDYNNSVNDYYSAVFADSYAIKNIITRVNVGILRDISEASSTQLNRQRNFFGPVDIQKLRITLYDGVGRIIDLNNMDWNVELIFECVYD